MVHFKDEYYYALVPLLYEYIAFTPQFIIILVGGFLYLGELKRRLSVNYYRQR